MYLKIHRPVESGEVVAVCDRELINTTVSNGDIEVCISESFYGTRLATAEEVAAVLDKAANANLMGERVIALAVERGLVDRDGCLMIGAVPHAQIIRV
jgi:uncharacterized protein